MTKELVIVIGMLVLYICSLAGLITAWVYYRKYKADGRSGAEQPQSSVKGGEI